MTDCVEQNLRSTIEAQESTIRALKQALEGKDAVIASERLMVEVLNIRLVMIRSYAEYMNMFAGVEQRHAKEIYRRSSGF